jgi:hypothetical protein
VTVSDFSSSSMNMADMYDELPPGAVEPEEIDYVTLEDVAKFKHYRGAARLSNSRKTHPKMIL